MFAVALHVRAWVEISRLRSVEMTVIGRPPCEGVGRNGVAVKPEPAALRRPPCEGVGRNPFEELIALAKGGSPSM